MTKTHREVCSATKGVAIVADVAFPLCVAVNCSTAGESTVTWPDGSTSAYYFTQGTSGNCVQITKVASGGAAAGLRALYNT